MKTEKNFFLVTGATGFVGSRLVRALVDQYGASHVTVLVDNHKRAMLEQQMIDKFQSSGVAIVECDLLDPYLLSERPLPNFDVLYHLAAYVSTETLSDQFRVNDTGTENLLGWLAPALRGKRVIFTGSLASVDRDQPFGPVTEDTRCSPKTPYGQSKYEGEELIRRNQDRFGYEYTVLRLCTIVGEGYRQGGMFDIFPKLLAQGALVTRLNWPGHTSLLSLSDLVSILMETKHNEKCINTTFVLSNGESLTFDQLLDQIANLMQIRRQRISLPCWVWSLVFSLAWRCVAIDWIPYRWRISFWRVSLMAADGIWADNTRIQSVIPRKYISVAESLRLAYRARLSEC